MGGGGGLLGGVTGALFGKPTQAATPDYTGAAQATAQGNLDAARAATAANRVNQITPYGSLVYSQGGTFDPKAYEAAYKSYQKSLQQGGASLPEGYSFEADPFKSYSQVLPKTGFRYAYGPNGDRIEVPISGEQLQAPKIEDFLTGTDQYGNPTWTATTTLSPDQQALYNYDIASAKGLGALQEKGLNYVGQMIDQPFSTSGLPQLSSQLNAPTLQTTLDNQGMAGWDKATGLVMQRLAPQLERQQKALDTQLANQGIMRGSEAYNQAQQDLAMKQNDLMNQATLGGLQAQQQFFGQGLQAGQFGNLAQQQMLQNQALQADLANRARGQGFQELAYQRNEPINTLNAVRSGSQVTTPNQFYVNAPQQATTAGADMLGAAGMTGNAAIAQANAENANRNAMMQGLFSLGGAAMMSDIRTKENIKYLGDLTNGLPFYEFEYKPEFKAIGGEGKFIGVMAQDVEKVQPEAVIELPSGYKMVNYGALQ